MAASAQTTHYNGPMGYKKLKWSDMEVEEKMEVLVESLKGLRKAMDRIYQSVNALHNHTHDEQGNPVNVKRTHDTMYDGPQNTDPGIRIALDSVDFSDPNNP